MTFCGIKVTIHFHTSEPKKDLIFFSYSSIKVPTNNVTNNHKSIQPTIEIYPICTKKSIKEGQQQTRQLNGDDVITDTTSDNSSHDYDRIVCHLLWGIFICFGECSLDLGREREYWDTSVREQLLVLSSRELAFLFS
jgi:hypothetical protein